jgi:branched-chain amino acid transport system permease protein
MNSVLSVFDVFTPYQTVAQFVLINALLASSMQVALRFGVFSVATVAFAAIGGYASAILTVNYHASLALALVGGALVAVLSTVILLYPVHRLRGLYLAISTLAMVIVLQVVVRELKITGGALGLFGIPIETQFWQLLLAAVIVAVLLAVLERSRTGRALRAIGEDEAAATASGINVGFYRTLAFVLSAVLGGVAGGFNSHLNSFIGPDQFGLSEVVLILSMVVLGGLGRWPGAFVGALVLTALPEVLRPLAAWRDIINGAILVLVIVYLPGGIADLPSRLRRLWAGRIRPSGSAALARSG